MYRYIFSDIDGTLRNSNREITERTKDCIEKLKEKGIEIILCSGRPRCEVERVSRECNASRYIISSNGAEVYDYISKKVIYDNPFQSGTCDALYEIARKYHCVFSMHRGNVRIVNQEKYNDETEIVIEDDKISSYYQDVVQCVIMDKNAEKMKVVKKKILQLPEIRIINESQCLTDETKKPNHNTYCDVVDLHTSKGRAINMLCQFLGISRHETIGIGDSYNDIEMLNFVGYSVAMGNALKSLKKKVNAVTDTNDLDGAAKLFEKILAEEPPFENKEVFE